MSPDQVASWERSDVSGRSMLHALGEVKSCSDKKLTEELLNELLDAPNIDAYIREHDFAAPSLSDYPKQLLQEKGLSARAWFVWPISM